VGRYDFLQGERGFSFKKSPSPPAPPHPKELSRRKGKGGKGVFFILRLRNCFLMKKRYKKKGEAHRETSPLSFPKYKKNLVGTGVPDCPQ